MLLRDLAVASLAAEAADFARLGAGFADRFDRPPSAMVDAPGRVNLIGEHTDYNGLPVLPVAIDRAVRVATAARDDGLVQVANLDPAFAPRSYRSDAIVAGEPGDWAEYHKAALRELRRGGELPPGVGLDVLVAGDVPAAAGLSSSAALVVASALAALVAVGRDDLEVVALAERLAAAERFVGTESGGMDQAVSLLARPGAALHIEFHPLRARPMPLPEDLVVVAAHSLVEAAKSGAARDGYNRRVAECAAACRGLSGHLDRPVTRLAEVADEPDREALFEAVAATAGTLSSRRVRHVLAEADRVDDFARALAADDRPAMGECLAASHASLRDDYQVSCPELDQLVAVLIAGGALGARVTGAGFGGCAMALVERGAAAGLLAALDERYYGPRLGAAEAPRWSFAARGGARLLGGAT